MCNSCRKLPDDGKLASLDQLVLRGAQGTLGTYTLDDFILELLIGGGKVRGTFIDLALQIVVGLLQGFSCNQTVLSVVATLVDHDRENAQQDRTDAGHRRPAEAHVVDLIKVRENGQGPRGPRCV